MHFNFIILKCNCLEQTLSIFLNKIMSSRLYFIPCNVRYIQITCNNLYLHTADLQFFEIQTYTYQLPIVFSSNSHVILILSRTCRFRHISAVLLIHLAIKKEHENHINILPSICVLLPYGVHIKMPILNVCKN